MSFYGLAALAHIWLKSRIGDHCCPAGFTDVRLTDSGTDVPLAKWLGMEALLLFSSIAAVGVEECVCTVNACVEYMGDAYEQAERLMLVNKPTKADCDRHCSVSSATLAKLSPPMKRTGLLYLVPC